MSEAQVTESASAETVAPEGTATPAATKEAPASPKTNLGEKFAKDAAWSRALAALEKQEGGDKPAEAAPASDDAETEAPVVEEEKQPEPVAAKELESDRWVEAARAKRAAQKAAAKRDAEFAAREAEFGQKASSVDQLAKAKQLIDAGKGAEALELLGVDYAEVTRQVLNGPPKEDTAAKELQAKVAEFEQWKSQFEQQQQAAALKQAEAGARAIVREQCGSLPEASALRSEPNWEGAVVDYIQIKWAEVGYAGEAPPITPAQAARELNALYVNDALETQRRLIEGSSEYRQQLAALLTPSTKPKPAQHANGANGSGIIPPPRTLTSAHSGEAGRLPPSNDPQELRRRAIAVAEQQFGQSES